MRCIRLTKLGLFILILIFGSTAAMAAFIAYTMLWDSSPASLAAALPHLGWWI